MADHVPTQPALEKARGFRWGQVPPTRAFVGAERDQAPAVAAAPAAPDLGAIASFKGTFRGNGFNTIFRPQNFGATPTPLPNPPHGIDDNIFELNLTEETLSFSDALGSIPNRGMVQGDAFLNGIPYLQTINDVTDPAQPVGIHFEPGVWLSVPSTTAPQLGATLVRMASIPHGTTIEAQGRAFTVAGGPRIDPVDITPFPIGNPGQRIPFDSQNVTDPATFRVPQDLTSLVASGAITQAMVSDPNLVLRNRANAQNITATTVIVVDTNPSAPLFGGGTDNIAFLLGDNTASAPNADAVRMTAIFWIETVSEQITVPGTGHGHGHGQGQGQGQGHGQGQGQGHGQGHGSGEPVIVQGSSAAGNPVATFAVTSATPPSQDTQVTVTYTQIQYTQTVFLNFNGLTWPHVSVANLIPNDPIPVTV